MFVCVKRNRFFSKLTGSMLYKLSNINYYLLAIHTVFTALPI